MKKRGNNKKLNMKIIIILAILIMSFFVVKVVLAASVVLKAEQNEGMNYINFSWNAPDTNNKWSYRLYQKAEGETEFETVSMKYNKPVKVLNVYPGKGDGLQQWMSDYGKGLISVDKVTLSDFNRNPLTYLKDNNGNYKYDVLMFGSWDSNNEDQDLSSNSATEVEKFILSGRGVLFGHDTMRPNKMKNFNTLAKYVKITLDKNISIYDGAHKNGNTDQGGISTVRIMKSGYLTKYPWNLGDVNTDLFVPKCHSNHQIPSGRIWMKFNYNEMYLDIPANFYLTSWGNCAMIQTGHSNGQATEDEQKIIANTLFYLGQLTEETNAAAYTAEDLAAPDNPEINVREWPEGGLDVSVTS